MRKIIVSTFISMDGVLQSPGGPFEDPDNHFKWGGWSVEYWDDLMNKTMQQSTSQPFDLLLGRTTYEIFAAHWPYQKDDPTSEKFNKIQKFVVSSRQTIDLSWQNSTLLTGDVAAELKKLKQQQGPDLLVNGSGKLVQTLLENKLVDLLHTWVFPITLGAGKKLFDSGTQPSQWKLTDAKLASTGVIIASYIPDGDIRLGSFVPDQISEKETERRSGFSVE
ncbi:dihydrofolate reductase family protein [Dyadobacter psychrotolerans]|uniref:Dihydrofolate reductase n=1 Tax=Dyadobacter psychrotolerans TaxID=2541721 RepID=A0A4R5DCU4_9BACT|nr:dihydrofolate reductase family protein [Dyadobacter psychrotolerans]TDE10827.1 dihydrofolate reductase [Dyadobacter psychrotolerans]